MDTFRKLNWKHDVFEAEYLTKKTDEEREYEAVVRTLSSLRLKVKCSRGNQLEQQGIYPEGNGFG